MEEHAVVAAELQRNRDRIRGLLLPGTLVDGRDDDIFPRSAAMRFMLDSRKRKLAMAALTTVMLLAGRRGFARTVGWAGIARSVAGLLSAARR